MLWTKILIAFDSSQGSWRAVEYVGQMFGRVDGIKVNLCGFTTRFLNTTWWRRRLPTR